MRTRTLAFILISVLWTSSAHSQNPASIDDLLKKPLTSACSRTYCTIYLNEPITLALFKHVETLIKERDPKRSIDVYIDSPGGDLAAAIRIGRLLRESAPIRAIVMPSAICASACVLTLVGATTRLVGGTVAIHRPYTVDSANRSYADLQRQFSAIDDQARAYLSQMNVAPSLYDEMLRYPPESVRKLSTEELERYRISGTDYVWEETMQRRHANYIGIDRQTYLHRLGTAARICATAPSQSPRETTEQWVARLVAATDCHNRVLQTGR